MNSASSEPKWLQQHINKAQDLNYKDTAGKNLS